VKSEELLKVCEDSKLDVLNFLQKDLIKVGLYPSSDYDTFIETGEVILKFNSENSSTAAVGFLEKEYNIKSEINLDNGRYNVTIPEKEFSKLSLNRNKL